MQVPVPKNKRFTVAEYLDWALAQPEGRFELVNGQVLAMAPERARHNLLKLAAVISLKNAVARAGVRCTAYTDGMTIAIDDYTAREPDALVQCGKSIDPESLIADKPVIVVEVVSPSSERNDITRKFSEYFSVESIQHYLVIDGEKRLVIHHARRDDGDILSRIIREGEIRLDPPGLVVPFDEMMPEPEQEPEEPVTDD